MENSYSKQRREEILGLLDPRLTDSEQADALGAFTEREIASAYRRGVRDGRGNKSGRWPSNRSQGPTASNDAPRVVDRARMTSEGRPLRYSSAVQAGIIKRVVHAQAGV